MKQKAVALVLAFTLILVMCACGIGQSEEPSEQNTEAKASETDVSESESSEAETTEAADMKLLIDDQEVQVDWEENAAVAELAKQVKAQPLTIDMAMYEDFEQVGELGVSLPAEDTQIETESGDIMLYASDKIVVFYGTNSWAYTRLGKITDKTPEEMTELLGQHDVTITLQ